MDRGWRRILIQQMPRQVASTLAYELSASELDCIRRHLSKPGFDGPCLEVGTAAGGTLCQMMACFTDANRPRFIVVDNLRYFQDQLESVRRNLRQHQLDPAVVDFRECTSAEAFPQAEGANERFGFILIDACHKIRHVTEDLRWARLLRVGGVMCLHDYGGHLRGVTFAVDRFLRRNPNYHRVELEGCLLVLRKTAASATPEITAGDHLWAALLAPWLQLQASIAKRWRRLTIRP